MLDCYFDYGIDLEGRPISVFDAREVVSKLLDAELPYT
jgi:hypothetical protein